MSTIYLVTANAILILHLLFIFWVVLGGLAVLHKPKLAIIHIPMVIWGFLVEAMGWYCPLTDLENMFLHWAGTLGYASGFLEKYFLALIYPEGLTREIQYILGAFVLIINVLIYVQVWRKRRMQSF